MAMNDIQIFYRLPIVAGFVQFPPNSETDKNKFTDQQALALINGSVAERFTIGSGHQTGSKQGAQEWIELPGYTPDYSTNPGGVAKLNGL